MDKEIIEDKSEDEISTKKPYKTFKDYYQDPEFKEKHRKRMSEKITCECGRIVMKANLSAHKKTAIHTTRMEKIEKETVMKECIQQMAEAYIKTMKKVKDKKSD